MELVQRTLLITGSDPGRGQTPPEVVPHIHENTRKKAAPLSREGPHPHHALSYRDAPKTLSTKRSRTSRSFRRCRTLAEHAQHRVKAGKDNRCNHMADNRILERRMSNELHDRQVKQQPSQKKHSCDTEKRLHCSFCKFTHYCKLLFFG